MNSLEVILNFILNLSAFIFVFRTIRIFNWSTSMVPIIVTLWMGLHFVAHTLLRGELWLPVFSFTSLFAVVTGIHWWIRQRQRSRYPGEVLFCLNALIVHLKTGKSLSIAMKKLRNENQNLMSTGVQRVFEDVAFSQHDVSSLTSPLLKRFRETLISVERSRHLGVPVLENFRNEVSFLEKFRHKSGQASLQAKMQACICVGLYAGISLLMIRWIGFAYLRPILPISVSSLFMGLVLLLWAGRKKKWMV